MQTSWAGSLNRMVVFPWSANLEKTLLTLSLSYSERIMHRRSYSLRLTKGTLLNYPAARCVLQLALYLEPARFLAVDTMR